VWRHELAQTGSFGFGSPSIKYLVIQQPQKRRKKMKKTLMVLVTIMAVSAWGTAYADKAAAIKGDAMSDPDCLINTLDPSNAPARAAAFQGGTDGSGAGGASAGSRMTADSLINTLDPSNAPKARIAARTETVGSREDADSLINYLDPSNAPRRRM
jgi:hypothetical protein